MKRLFSGMSLATVFVLTLSIAAWATCGPGTTGTCSGTASCTITKTGCSNPVSQGFVGGTCLGGGDTDNDLCTSGTHPVTCDAATCNPDGTCTIGSATNNSVAAGIDHPTESCL